METTVPNAVHRKNTCRYIWIIIAYFRDTSIHSLNFLQKQDPFFIFVSQMHPNKNAPVWFARPGQNLDNGSTLKV